jgi:membrane protease YdiL (CAAX protease family)
VQQRKGRDVNVIGLILLWLGYTVVSIGLWRLVPTLAGWDAVPYTELSSTTESLLQNVMIAEAITASLVFLLVVVLGWGKAVLKDTRPVARWLVAVPIIVAITALATADWSNLADMGGSHILVLALTTVFIGISEETMFRGVFVVGMRRLGRSEMNIWFWSSLAFALIHAGNAFVGAGVNVVAQTVLAFFGGTVFYIARRATGTLLVPIALHALYDFSVFSHTGDTRSFSAIESRLLLLVVFVLFIVIVIKRDAWSDTETAQIA